MKKGILYFLVAFIVLGIVFFKLSDVYADEEEDEVKKCEPETRTYLFSEASSGTSGRTTTYSTAFYNDLPEDARILSITTTNVRSMTESDFLTFMSIVHGNAEECYNVGGNKDVCKLGKYYTNYGVVGGGEYTGGAGGSTTDSERFRNETMPAKNPQVTFSDGGVVDGIGTLNATVTRSWDEPTEYIKNLIKNNPGSYSYLIPVAADVTIEYESADCIEEDDDADDPTDNECPPDSVSSNDLANKHLDCTGANYKQTKNERNLTVTRTISTSDSDHGTYYKNLDKGKKDDGTDYCSRELTEKITWDAALTQEGYLNFNLNPNSQYSGGGFDFTIDYNANAYYELCGATYKVYEEKVVYTCPTKSAPDDSSRDYGNGTVTSSTSVSVSGGGENSVCTYTYTTNENLSVSSAYYEDNPDYYDNACLGNISCFGGLCTCNVSSSSRSETEDAKPSGCNDVETETYSCFEGHDSPGIDCSNNSNEVKEIASKMATFLQESQITNSNPESYNSNDENLDTYENMGGEWNANSVTTNSWLPAQTIRYSASYRLKHACINRFTALVEYKDSCDDNTEIDGGNLYYIPLKEPNGDFPVRVYAGGNANSPVKISILNNMDWGFTYDCDVNCRQELFDLEKGGYLYFFRPIALDNPFPNRTPGVNWQDWIFFQVNQERLIDTYSTTNNIEYIVYLENEDVNAIKEYNSNTTYLDYSNSFHDKEGNSEFINTRFNYLFDLKNVKHSALGEYNPEDDTP